MSQVDSAALYQEAAELLARGIGADRSAVFTHDPDGPTMRAVVGVREFAIIACPFSLPTVTEVITTNRNLVYTNAPDEARENSSLRFSGAISMLCVPFYDQAENPVGALYADTTLRPRAFHRKELLFARDCAVWLEARLAGKTEVPKPEPASLGAAAPRAHATGTSGSPAPSSESQPPAAGPEHAPSDSKSQPKNKAATFSELVVDSKHLMVFFRSLASLTRAGVHIDSSLRLLGESSEDRAMGEVARGLATSVFRGNPVSTAMEHFPRAFSPTVRATVQVGERTGRMVEVLEVLSADLEKSQRLQYRMRSALTYPAFLGAICTLMLLLGPPYLLQGHLKVLAESGVPLPMVTRALLMVSKLVGNPWSLLVIAGLVCGALFYLRSQRGARQLMALARKAPVIGPILGLLSMTELARSLAIQLKAGLTALEALAQARQGSTDPRMVEAIREAEDGIRNGDSLAEGLGRSKLFSATFLSFIEAGEQTGTLVRLSEWLADFYEMELEASLTRFVSMAEPAIMAFMGVVAAILMVATIKPTVLILQAL